MYILFLEMTGSRLYSQILLALADGGSFMCGCSFCPGLMCLRLLSGGRFEAWVGGGLLVCSSGEGGNGYLGCLPKPS